ncbi:MAG: hypothetical protein JNG89_20175 [Planctomycetaceae bacterium]|nr:hypothetical protein [Planctomycetaceae bacterium]
MAIEFSCPKCQHLLRTADDKAGLSAKCPACGEIIWVPYSSAEPTAPASATPPPQENTPADGYALAADAVAASDPATDAAAATDAPPTETLPRRRSGAEVNCPHCHAENDASARNCRFCGGSLEGAAPVQNEPPTIPPFDVSEIMNSAWKLYQQELGLMLGAAVIMMFLPILVVLPCMLPIVFGVSAVGANDEEAALLVIIPAVLILFPLMLALGAVMQLGTTKLYLNIARGDGPTITDLFWGFTADGRPLILPVMLVMLAAGALMIVGCLLCVAPGMLISLCWWPALPMLIDRRLTGSDAIGQTIELCKKDIGSILAVGAIAMGVQTIPSFIPYIGVILQLFAVPLAQLLIMIGYLRITRQATQFERWKGPATGAAQAPA